MIPANINLKFLLNISLLFFESAKLIKTIRNYFNFVFGRYISLCIFARSFRDRSKLVKPRIPQKIKDN